MIAVLLAQAALAQTAPCDTRTLSDMDQAEYDRARVEQESAGYRLARETVDDDAGRPRFAALWVRDGKPPQASRGAHGVDGFYFASLEMTGKDHRLTDLTVGVVAGSPYFSALWAKNRSVQQTVDYWLTERELRRKLAMPKHRVLAISPYRIGNITYFAALFDVADGLRSSAVIDLTASALDRRDAEWQRRGYVLSRVARHPGRPGRFTAVWQSAEGLSACERETGRLDPAAPLRP